MRIVALITLALLAGAEPAVQRPNAAAAFDPEEATIAETVAA